MLRAIEVTLERDGEAVDRVERLPRRLPDGGIGIEYMGLVYPLARAGRAALDGRWCYASQAPICLDPPEELGAWEERRFWELDRAGTRPYLFIDGSEPLLVATLDRLGHAGIAVEHHGPSFREGETGRLHDWFVRLGAEDAPREWELAQLLANVAEPETRDEPLSTEMAAAKLKRDHDRLADRLIAVERELAAALAIADTNAGDLARAKEDASRAALRFETEAAFLRAGIAALRTERPTSDDTVLDGLRIRVDAITADRDEALAAWTRAEDGATGLRQELEATQARFAESLARATEVTSRAATPTFASKKLARADAELQTVLRVLLPSVELVRGSTDFILTEVADRRDLYTKLKLLVADPVALGGKRVHATNGWLEVHMGTGQGRDGRLYYKKAGEIWLVLVSDKAAQPGDLEWLKSQ